MQVQILNIRKYPVLSPATYTIPIMPGSTRSAAKGFPTKGRTPPRKPNQKKVVPVKKGKKQRRGKRKATDSEEESDSSNETDESPPKAKKKASKRRKRAEESEVEVIEDGEAPAKDIEDVDLGQASEQHDAEVSLNCLSMKYNAHEF